ncbi:cysteine desulfurase [Mesorhizobium sp. YC-39]|uniref:cysteine desulfurase family protein n=1 Tax=unclassified Mesorhizobium TaxID=325217 RepID=UPI0021E90773|nr:MULTISPECIES: cysteine desulfurase family protein [unclassified Mesorhizobium]MCV3211093.1 cysteine desulfurase [Mesorhizobium sp. YC-2]MCV3232818.1 cysteine desulfurase [Mesorhizobium sp. YC-39]
MSTTEVDLPGHELGPAHRADRGCVESGYPIYLDGHSTTPLAPEALTAMEPWWHRRAGNPNSPHRHGQFADAAVENARGQVAKLIGATPGEIHFTSGATEANNLALIGSALGARARGSVRTGLVVSEIEHKSVLNAAYALERQGFTVETAPVNADGVIDLTRLSTIVSENTLLVSVMAANNEIGAVQPLAGITDIVRTKGALLHVDAAQLVGKLPFDATTFDCVSLSSHKMYGPMGVGALFVSGATAYRPQPILYGGDQEGGLRPGTIATPLVVGFGRAAELAATQLASDARHAGALAERFEAELRNRQVRFIRHGTPSARLPGSVSIAFEGIDATELIAAVSSQISISEGSACQSGQITPSHVLRAIAVNDHLLRSTVRLYFGRYNSEDDAMLAADAIASAVAKLRLRTGDSLQ